MRTPTLTQIPPTDVVVVPASFALLPMLTVEENVVLPLRLAGLGPIRRGFVPCLRRSSWTAALTGGPVTSPAESSFGWHSHERSRSGRRRSSSTT